MVRVSDEETCESVSQKEERESVMSKPRGLYRIQGEEGKPNTAFVEGGTLGFYVLEQQYREEGFEPDFDELPCEPQYCVVETEKDDREPGA